MRNEHTAAGARNILFITLVVILGGLYFSLSYNGVLFLPDEGATAYHFEKATEGAVQHRDFYSVYGMAYYLVGKALFGLFGAKLIVLRIFTVVVKLMIAVMIYLVGIHLMSRGFAFLGAMGFIIWWADPFVTTPLYLYPAHLSQLFGLLSVLLVLAFVKSDRKLFVLFAGVAVGLNSLFKPNVGVFNLMALFLFFIYREALLNLSQESRTRDAEEARRGFPYGEIGLTVELTIMLCAIIVMFRIFSQFGFDLIVFSYFLLPIFLTVISIMGLGIESLRIAGDRTLAWRNFKETFLIHWLLAAGFALCQLLQIAYFAGNQALGDFFNMLDSASEYYSGYAVLFWEGWKIIALSAASLIVVFIFSVVIKRTVASGARAKIFLAGAALLVVAAAPVYWLMQRFIPGRHAFAAWSVPMLCSLLISLFLAFRYSRESVRSKHVSSSLGLTLVCFYASANFLDAFPKVDLGHCFMVLPPVLVLFGFLAQRLYECWKDYLDSALPRAGKALASVITGVLLLEIFVPSLMMMLMFQFLIVPSAERGLHLYGGKLALAPRYRPNVRRAEGMALHMFRDNYWPPLVDPEMFDFFELTKRVIAITKKEDKIFSTMTSGLMLFFLADRDSVSDIANCYVWQTSMGTTSSAAIKDFSDRDLLQTLSADMPKAIIVEQGPKNDLETKRFIENWPITWSFIKTNYRIAESVGAYRIYVPAR